MKKFFFLLLSLLLVACKGNNEPSIFLGNDTVFKLQFNEVILSITPEVQQHYAERVGVYDSHQIPIYKVIKGNDYTMYIGMAMRIKSVREFIEHYPDTPFTNTSEQTAYRSFTDKNGEFVSEYIFKSHSNFYYIITETKNKTIQTDFFSEQSLNQRIEIKK